MGCGTELLGARLGELGYTSIHGVDYSPEMLGVAERTGAYRSLWPAYLNEALAIDDHAYRTGD